GFTGNPYLYRFVEGDKAIGGSVGYLEIANNTRALLGGMETDSAGTPRRTASGPLQVTAGSGGVNVNATNDTYVIQLTDAGDKATNFGFSGAASYLDAHSSSQVTEAAIDGPAAADRKAVVVSAGPVAVTAADSTYLIPIAGAVVLGDGKGVGVSTAIARLDRGVTARVGSKDDEPETGVGWVDMRAADGLTTAASAGGAVTPAALAGTVISQAKPAGEQRNVQDLEQPIQGLGNQPQGAFGLAVSGDFTWAEVDDAVRATVNTRGTITDTASSRRTLEVSARNTTVIQAIAGAAAILKTTGDGSSASLAGSAAIIDAESTVIASVRRATLRGFVLDVSATNERPIGAQAASGSGAVQARQNTGTNVQVAGSVTLTTITTTTKATIDGVTAVDLGGLRVAAATRDTVWSAAGSFLANFSPAGGKAEGRCLGVGEAFAENDVTNTTQATVVDSALICAGDVQLSAVDAARLLTFAAGVIVTGAGSALGGMFSFVTADSTTNAAIDGGSVDVTLGGVDIVAISALLMVTGAGDLIIGRGEGSSVAVGAAVASVGGTLGTTARVGRGASVRVRKGNLSVSSRTRNPDADPAID
ncbi:MAG: hypothetical protein EBS51_15715, partial [Planctomycetia bacterium]|nr:hypothetical protein [Planctomycetia bacterium]